MEYAITRFCEECASELYDLCFNGPYGAKKYSNDSNVSPRLSEEFFCDCKNYVGVVMLCFFISKTKLYNTNKETILIKS